MPSPAGQTRADEIVAAYNEHYFGETARKVETETGFAAAVDRANAITAAMDSFVEAILATPAKTAQGIAVKLKVALAFKNPDAIPDDITKHTGDIETDALCSVLRAVQEVAGAASRAD